MILPALTCLILGVPAVLTLYRKIRPLFSVKVNCWFCGNTTVVPYGNINCWDCPTCEQYNGFKEDGDYNKPIPAQYDEALNFASTAGRLAESSLGSIKSDWDNELCSTCNYHQLIKIRLLADFTPTREDRFDSEVEEYQKRLEEVYALCGACTQRLRHRLSEQDSLLRPQLFSQPWYRPPWQRTSRRTVGFKERVRLLLSVLSSVLGLLVSFSLLLVLLDSWSLLGGPGGRWDLAPLLGSRPPSPLVLRVTGMTLAAGSVLLAGPRRFGTLEVALCWFWLLVLLLGLPWTARTMERRQLLWLGAALAGVTTALGAARTTALLLLHRRRWREGQLVVRKLGNFPGTSLSSSPSGASGASLSSGSFTSCKPDWETRSSRSRSQSQVIQSTEAPAAKNATARGEPLQDLLKRVHISSDSELPRSSGPRSAPGRESPSKAERPSAPNGSCASGPARPLLWPPGFRPSPRSSPPGSSGLARAAGNFSASTGGGASPSPSGKGLLSTAGSEFLWGMKQTFGMLTPPPSLAGSTGKDSATSTRKPASQTMQASSNPLIKRSVISTSSASGPLPALAGSFSLAPPSAIASQRSTWLGGRSPSNAEGDRGTCFVRQRANGGPPHEDDCEKMSFIGSSVSQNTRWGLEKSTAAGYCQTPAKERVPCSRLLLVLSVGANVLLFAYFVALPGVGIAVQ
uniref:Putative transmembrane protein n=1 Tax=Ixodes ricinus TaxID=34613 RepID=A0A147BH56_IXORI